MQPLVTVILINHNYGKWVAGAINSVLNSDYPNKRLVVIDDASTDDSAGEIMKAVDFNKLYISGQSLFDILHKTEDEVYFALLSQNGGPSRARNLGIRPFIDKTDLFITLDSDDEFYPDRISKLVKIWETNPKIIGGVYSDYHLLYEDGTKIYEYKKPFSLDLLRQECIVHSSCLFSNEAIKKAGFYDESLRVCEDYDLWLRMAQNHLFVHHPEATMLVRTGSHNSTSTVAKERWNRDMAKVRAKWMQ